MRNIYKGWTLIELVMVMVILAIVAVISFASISSYRNQNLRAAAERVASDLRYVKNQAISSTTWHGVIFNVHPANTYTAYQTDGATDTPLKDLQDPGRDFTINLSTLYGGVQISAVNIAGGKVKFDPYGTPYNGTNGAVLDAPGVVTLALGSLTVTVSIEPQTGRVSLQ